MLDVNQALLDLLHIERSSIVGRYIKDVGVCVNCGFMNKEMRELAYGNRHTLRAIGQFKTRSQRLFWGYRVMRRKGYIPATAFGPPVKYAFGTWEEVEAPPEGVGKVISDVTDFVLDAHDPMDMDHMIEMATRARGACKV
jgi:hypothetical protein